MKSQQIRTAIVWAVVILAQSFLMKDTPNFNSMFFLLLGASTIQIGILSTKAKKYNCSVKK